MMGSGRGADPRAGPPQLADTLLPVSELFSVRLTVRGYEVDTQGHLNWAEYLHYAEHARWSCLAAAGVSQDKLIASGFGPAVLDVSVKFKRELLAGDEIDVTCAFVFSGGKTFQIVQDFLRPSDTTLAASLTSTNGLLDLAARRLTDDPRAHLRKVATNLAPLGLA
jgi:acyl-CoA thioester hydrolase